ncbi:hypothetical protein PISMIDRAFT_568821 [Pisolithus microcarpus 441]|uniref:Uncharacterized protein n=1 Tax=Pisolithus microcarpus 441 TaxID=765257 RepID=A0A0C9ZF25_9AGAM|nr:hypothetical protein PISMIDRAFT_568821 [Pisolithus microcarpus 441]
MRYGGTVQHAMRGLRSRVSLPLRVFSMASESVNGFARTNVPEVSTSTDLGTC